MLQNLSNREWIEYQFDHRKNRREFRDVILYTSFIESVIVGKSLEYRPLGEHEQYRSFGNAIQELEKSSTYQGKLEAIKTLKQNRDDLVHKVIPERLSQDQIEEKIKTLYSLIVRIFKSDIFNSIWDSRYYGFLPKDKFSEFESVSDEYILGKSFDS